jgi:hypothetical protein
MRTKGAEYRAEKKQKYATAAPGFNSKLDMFGGSDAIDVVLAKRFQSVKAFDLWKRPNAGQKMLQKYPKLKAKSLEDGGVIVWDDADDNGDFDAGKEELIARNGYTIRHTPIGKGGVAKPRYQKRVERSEWIVDNGGNVKSYKRRNQLNHNLRIPLFFSLSALL